MKITTPEESAYILARLCSETFNNDGIKYYLKSSPTESDFRNRFAAVLFRAFLEALHTARGEYTSRAEAVKLAERFGAAREELDDLGSKFDNWLSLVEHFADRVPGFKWGTQRRHAAAGALIVLEAVRNLGRAYGAIRFDPYSNTQPEPQS